MVFGDNSTDISITIADTKNEISADETEALRKKIVSATRYFMKNYFHLENPQIFIEINPARCLRTGHNFIENKIVFCPTNKSINMGLNSIDVINHELFHFLLCQIEQNKCTRDFMKNNHNKAIHEGLADHFSYQLERDSVFGEGFHTDVTYLRTYRNDLCIDLVSQPHLKGSALASYVIKNNISIEKIRTFIKTFDLDIFKDINCLAESTTLPVFYPLNKPYRKSHRYWMKQNESIEFEIDLEGATLSLVSEPSKFDVIISGSKIKFSATNHHGFEKIILNFHRKNKIIGRINVYLGVRKE